MKLILTERVQRVVRTLPDEDRRRVQTWFNYLENWETDDFVRSRSVRLDVHGNEMYMFRTSTDIRIFFTVDDSQGTITIRDLAERETILSSGAENP